MVKQKMNPPQVSVIIPVYNMEQYLQKCLDSVLEQNIDQLEIIIVDDGSTDNSREIEETYQSKFDNIIVIEQNRKGSGHARNTGLLRAKGEFVAFMDSDDYYASEYALEILYSGAKKNGVKVAGGNLLRDTYGCISKNLHFHEGRFDRDFITDYMNFQGTSGHVRYLFDREMLIHNNIMYPDYKRFQDPVFLVKALDKAGRIWLTKEDVYVYRSFDKAINYENAEIVRDIAKGIFDITSFSVLQGYEHIIEWLIRYMSEKMKPIFLRQIVSGDEDLYRILHEIDEIINDKKSLIDGYYFGLNKEDMTKEVLIYQEWIQSIVEKIKEKNDYIIYGAGEVGRCAYDILRNIPHVKFRGFAVSNHDPVGTARGQKVFCIEDYTDEKDTLAVVVAALNPLCMELKKNAEKMGFVNVIIVDREMH